MKKKYLKISALATACSMVWLIIPGILLAFTPQDLNPGIKSGEYVKKTDGFIIILDVSGSKDESVNGKTKIEISKEIIQNMNLSLPDIEIDGALRIFGRARTLADKNKTELVYGPEEYSVSRSFDTALDKITHGRGLSFMASAINAAADDLNAFVGKTTLIIISDGKIHMQDPVIEAKKLKEKHGDKVCIVTIFIPSNTADRHQVGRDKKLMRDVSKAGGCGFAENAENLATGETMSAFVKNVFLSMPSDSDGDGVNNKIDQCPNTPMGVKVDDRGCPFDKDKDGIPDHRDDCPDTPIGIRVNAKGCAQDSDADGVTDDIDKCPETPQGTKVDDRGCKIDGESLVSEISPTADRDNDGVYDSEDRCLDTPEGVKVDSGGCWTPEGLSFEINRAKIKKSSYAGLDKVVRVLKNKPNLTIEIGGHTDYFGSARYNKILSLDRAKAVMNYLIKKGISKDRLKATGYGFTIPADSNATPEGRAKNRRVELKTIR